MTVRLNLELRQSSACQRSLVEVHPTIPVCTLVGSVDLCVRPGLCGASNPWRSSPTIQILRGSVVVQTSLVPSREYALRTVRFPVNNAATIKVTHCPTDQCAFGVVGHRVASTALAISLIRSSRAALIPSMRDPFTTPLSMGASFPIDKVHCHTSMPP